MKTENKIVSLELAKEMKKLGWRFETERYWFWDICPDRWCFINRYWYKKESYNNKPVYPAPDAIEIEKEFIRLKVSSPHYNYWANEYTIILDKIGQLKFGKNMTEAYGKTWCYLKEKELI